VEERTDSKVMRVQSSECATSAGGKARKSP
jgi:hypothetical protein